jgi:hypothetical protein
MKFNKVNKETQEKALKILQETKDKTQAIVQVVEMLNQAQNQDLINQLIEENEIYSRKENEEKLGIRTLNQKEKEFYQTLKNAKQSFEFGQDDIIPTEIIDRTLADIKPESQTLMLCKFAPADVKKWITASKTGSAKWGALTDSIVNELSATIESIDYEVNKLSVMLIIPKAVRDLAMPFVDKYFRAILGEAMHDGLVDGYINGDGKTGPIGITKTFEVNTDKTNKDKTVNKTLTGFSPKQLAPVKKLLSNDGKRAVPELYLIANPEDAYEYVEPALYFLTPNGYITTSRTKINVIEEPMMKQGTAVITIPDVYTLGLTQVGVKEYKETKATEDADILICKAYGNGRADDENTSYVFDVTKLKEYVPQFTQVAETA